MALEPKFGIIASDLDPRQILVTDNTGDYSPDNLGGYGTPNPTQGDIQWVFVITLKTKGQKMDFAFDTIDLVYKADDTENPVFSGNVAAYAPIDFGGVFSISAYGFLKLITVSSPVEGAYYYDSENGYFVMIQSGLPVEIDLEDIVLDNGAYVVENSYFYAFELDRMQAKLLEELPTTDTCDLEEWMRRWTDLEKDSEVIRILSCRKFYNNALMILAEYQNKIINEDC